MKDDSTQDQTEPRVLLFADTPSWMQAFVSRTLKNHKVDFTTFNPDTNLQKNQSRLQKYTHYIISWESKYRFGGALIQNLIDLFEHLSPREQVIILTQEPTQEDVIYFGELGVRKVLHVHQESSDLVAQAHKVHDFLFTFDQQHLSQWQSLLKEIYALPEDIDEKTRQEILKMVEMHSPQNVTESAQKYDAKALLYAASGDKELAEDFWRKAFNKNPRYHLAHSHFVAFLKKHHRFQEAIEHLLQLHKSNSKNIARMVDIGDAHKNMNKPEQAETYYNNALNTDKSCAGALNGLATIKFESGDLDASKELLKQSPKAYQAAALLNQKGIELVMQSQFEQALEHYNKAQYVLPNHEKGPLLFYNMGLCYWRWNQPEKAREYVKIALIKNPEYEKAQALMAAIDEALSPTISKAS